MRKLAAKQHLPLDRGESLRTDSGIPAFAELQVCNELEIMAVCVVLVDRRYSQGNFLLEPLLVVERATS